jgi:hypothetical protein
LGWCQAISISLLVAFKTAAEKFLQKNKQIILKIKNKMFYICAVNTINNMGCLTTF